MDFVIVKKNQSGTYYINGGPEIFESGKSFRENASTFSRAFGSVPKPSLVVRPSWSYLSCVQFGQNYVTLCANNDWFSDTTKIPRIERKNRNIEHLLLPRVVNIENWTKLKKELEDLITVEDLETESKALEKEKKFMHFPWVILHFQRFSDPHCNNFRRLFYQ